MKVDIYKSNKNGSKYLTVPEGTDVTKINLPTNIDPDLLDLSLSQKGLELDPNKPRIALDETDIENQISKQGYAVHGVSITSTVRTAP